MSTSFILVTADALKASQAPCAPAGRPQRIQLDVFNSLAHNKLALSRKNAKCVLNTPRNE